jgi:class 3 adenylate cyclase
MRKGVSLWWKMMLSIVSLVILIVIIVLITSTQMFENRITTDITRNFQETGRIFERIQEIRFRLLYQTAVLLADTPVLKNAVSTGDVNTVTNLIQNDLIALLDFDPILPDSLLENVAFFNQDSLGIVLVLDRNGYPLGQLSSAPLPRHSLADRPGITEALSGEYPDRVYIWEQDGRYFNVVSVPIWSDNTLLGTLSFGFPIRQLESEQLARDTGSEVLYFIDNQLLVHSLRLNHDSKIDWARGIYAASFEVLDQKDALIFELNTSGTTWLVYIASMLPLDEAQRGITGYYVVARSLDEALAPLYSLQRILFLVGIGAVILAVFISAGLTARINRPVQLLIEGIKRIEGGNYSEQVPIITRDELSTLTHTFNSLVINLRERLLMLKFVSKATLEAIQKNLSSVEPGGTRKEVTVFFSDIRGFTSWSEKKAPEVVIDMLNRCLHMQADLVKECGGDVDKFVGDELVAVFEGEKKEANAVEAAIRIQHEMVKLIQDVKDIHVGIGINTGEVVMGAVGSRDRMDYTVIGNHVNLGARLCSAAAKGQILISQSVFEHLERRIETKNLEPIRVKGIENPVPIYEIVWNGGTV